MSHLMDKAQACRSNIIDMLTAANSSHLGCSFSIIDILVVLYHQIMNVELLTQQKLERDYFILSKGHGAAALYSVLASAGLIDPEELKNYHKNGSFLAGHPTRSLARGIEASTGSLGHGLSMAVGLALAAKHDQRTSRVYALVGDGECQEGAIWEAIIMATRFGLDNLTVIVDYNNLQGLNKTDEIMTGKLTDIFSAYGCNVLTVNGHDHNALINVFGQCGKANKPDVIIAHTIKGKGIGFIENRLEWHYRSFKPDQYLQAKQELGS